MPMGQQFVKNLPPGVYLAQNKGLSARRQLNPEAE
jgi:hypothetical protein